MGVAGACFGDGEAKEMVDTAAFGFSIIVALGLEWVSVSFCPASDEALC